MLPVGAMVGLGVMGALAGYFYFSGKQSTAEARETLRHTAVAVGWFEAGLASIHAGSFGRAKLAFGLAEESADEALRFVPGLCDVALIAPTGLKVEPGHYYRVRTLEQAAAAKTILLREIAVLDRVLTPAEERCAICGNPGKYQLDAEQLADLERHRHQRTTGEEWKDSDGDPLSALLDVVGARYCEHCDELAKKGGHTELRHWVLIERIRSARHAGAGRGV